MTTITSIRFTSYNLNNVRTSFKSTSEASDISNKKSSDDIWPESFKLAPALEDNNVDEEIRGKFITEGKEAVSKASEKYNYNYIITPSLKNFLLEEIEKLPQNSHRESKRANFYPTIGKFYGILENAHKACDKSQVLVALTGYISELFLVKERLRAFEAVINHAQGLSKDRKDNVIEALDRLLNRTNSFGGDYYHSAWKRLKEYKN